MFLYVLQLEDNKWFVGKTKNLDQRLDDHFDPEKHGSHWTNKYKPLKKKEIIELCVKDYAPEQSDSSGTKKSSETCDPVEDEYTMYYMTMYGIDNVRGGSFCNIFLRPQQINYIQSVIRERMDLCFKCGMDDHFVKDCPFFKKKCTTCGRDTHTDSKCFAIKDIHGNYIQKDE